MMSGNSFDEFGKALGNLVDATAIVVDRLESERDTAVRETADAYDQLGQARGEALVLRRTLEWLRYKCDRLPIAKQVAANALDYLGYTAPTDDTVLGEIYAAPFMQRNVPIGELSNVD